MIVRRRIDNVALKHSLSEHLLFHITQLRAINVTGRGRKQATKCCLESIFTPVIERDARGKQPTRPYGNRSDPLGAFGRSFTLSRVSASFSPTFSRNRPSPFSVLASERALPPDVYAHR